MTENKPEDHARRAPSRLRRAPAAGPSLDLNDGLRRRCRRDRGHRSESRRERGPVPAARRRSAVRRREPLRGLRARALLAPAELRVLLLGGRDAAAVGHRAARGLLLRPGLGGESPGLVQGRLQHRQLPHRRAGGARRRVSRRRVLRRRGARAGRGGGAGCRRGRLHVPEPPPDRLRRDLRQRLPASERPPPAGGRATTRSAAGDHRRLSRSALGRRAGRGPARAGAHRARVPRAARAPARAPRAHRPEDGPLQLHALQR